MTSGGPTIGARDVRRRAAKSGQIPGPVMHAARRALVDHIGVTVAGSADDATRRAREAIGASENGRGRNGCRARGCGYRRRLRPSSNAFASHVLDLDDVYNPPGTTVHGSCSVWPAILAIADDRPVSGRDALASFALGFRGGDAGRARRGPDPLRRRLARDRNVRVMSGRPLRPRAPWASTATRSSTRWPPAPHRPRGCGSWRAAISKSMHPGKAAMDGRACRHSLSNTG